MDLIITILPVVTKDLPISPRFAPYDFLSRCKFSTLTTRQPLVEFYLLTFPRFPLRKKDHKSYFGKNRTHDFRTSRCAVYLLDDSDDILLEYSKARIPRKKQYRAYNKQGSSTSTEMILRPPVYCDAPSNICKYNTACLNGSGTLILSCLTALLYLVYVFGNASQLYYRRVPPFRPGKGHKYSHVLFVPRLCVHSRREVENSPLSRVGWPVKR